MNGISLVPLIGRLRNYSVGAGGASRSCMNCSNAQTWKNRVRPIIRRCSGTSSTSVSAATWLVITHLISVAAHLLVAVVASRPDVKRHRPRHGALPACRLPPLRG